MELQDATLATRQNALHAVDVVFVGKGEGDFGSVGGGMDQGVIAFASLTEECPGDRVQQRRFARTVGPGDAGQLKAGEIHFDGVMIGEKA